MHSSDKIQKASKGMAKFLHILYVINIAVMVLIALGLLSLVFYGTDRLESSLALSVRGGMRTPLDPNNINNFIITMIGLVIALIALIVILKHTTRIFRDIGNGETPFTKKQIDRIKRISITLLIMWAVEHLTVVIWAYTTSWTYPMHLDFRTFLMAFIVYCFALIFEYGCELQQLSDETI